MKKKLNIKHSLQRILNYFLQGLLYVAPIGLTFFIIIKVFEITDSILRPLIEGYTHFRIPGLGVLLMFILITLLGIAGKTVIAKPIKLALENLIKKSSVLYMVYTSIRDFMEAFVGKEKKFNQPVLVKVNSVTNLEKIGFITQTDLSELNIQGKVAVYFPHSYNFSGELFIVPVDQVTPLDLPSGEVMKFIVSGGITKV